MQLHTQGLQSFEQIRAFLQGSQALDFEMPRLDEAYALITQTLRRFGYARCNHTQKGLLRAYLGTVTAIVTGATTARAKGFNAVIQKIQSDARDFRNRHRFKAAIYFHLGGLDLYPESLRA